MLSFLLRSSSTVTSMTSMELVGVKSWSALLCTAWVIVTGMDPVRIPSQESRCLDPKGLRVMEPSVF